MMTSGETTRAQNIVPQWGIGAKKDWGQNPDYPGHYFYLPEKFRQTIEHDEAEAYMENLLELDARFQALSAAVATEQLAGSVRTALNTGNLLSLLDGDKNDARPGFVDLGDQENKAWLLNGGILGIGCFMQQSDKRYGWVRSNQFEIVPGTFTVSTRASLMRPELQERTSRSANKHNTPTIVDAEYAQAYITLTEALAKDNTRFTIDTFRFIASTVDDQVIHEWQMHLPEITEASIGLQVLGGPIAEAARAPELLLFPINGYRYWNLATLHEWKEYHWPKSLTVHADYLNIQQRVAKCIVAYENLLEYWKYSEPLKNSIGASTTIQKPVAPRT